MVGLVRTSNQFKGRGHALVFDGEIKGWVTQKSGPRTPNLIAIGAMLHTNRVHILYTPLHTAPHGTCLKKEERERRKNVWLDLTAVKLAQEVGFVLPAWLAGISKANACSHSSTKGSRQSPLDPFAYTSIPHFVLGQKR